ncbi:Ddi1p NDAI_0C05890 [Naumovozyma dairenensis CBS 421]|uniref:DNA damage-inducible protein 1 n=1 Tax=Naumovozyma dairenensis (strain ATCC 10597 / BCRC 20456 / CBS 421 / NBRC 0211 / NRRL Y-12639) TaxID=1071378 RepID=G0W8Y7_NAUDC|nr:hypothetical protein NDAI_0C05890 [Naumovozyma dairenensis CBS 421]CCD24248.1 hypothetical protein NDAI_0C05890 [Naumovozyma dairenensis CBS 421]
MDLTISNEVNGEVYGPIEINEDMSIRDLKALLEIDCHFDANRHDLYCNATLLDIETTKTLKELGLKKDDLLLIRSKIGNGGAQQPTAMSDEQLVEQFRQELQNNVTLRNQLSFQIPGLDQLVENKQLFHETMGPPILEKVHGGSRPTNPFGIPQAEYAKLMSNPDDPENQKRITELIDQQAINEQLQNALEYTPEVFFQVPMLYVNLEVNGYPVKAFVDSGAQSTIMSVKLAEKTGLTRLIDKRYAGEARGVGTGKFLGRIHQAQVKIETQFVPCTFSVIDIDIDILLGLDMLRRHRGCIDLEKNVLRFAGIETPFLSESEIPKNPIFDQEKGTITAAPESAPSNKKSPEVPVPTTGSYNSGVQMPKTATTGKTEITKNLPPPTTTSSIPAAAPGAVPSSVPKTAAPTATNPAPTATATAQRSYPENTIKQLMDLGFPRNQVITALNRTGGNAEYAAALLFQ